MNKFKSILCSGILLLGCIGMVSCSAEDEISKSGEAGFITLQLNSSMIDTRATEAGEDAYNENVIATVDCFFYPENETTSNAVLTYAATVNTATGQGTITIPSNDIDKLFPETKTKAVVYAIANLPATQRAALKDMANTSIADLKAIAISADFKKPADSPAKKQDSFVMDGQAEVTLTKAEMKVTGTVWLERAASKIALFITKITGTATDSDGVEWVSNPAGMTVSFCNGVSKATVDVTGKDLTYTNEDYFKDTRTYTGSVSTGYAQELPFYSYSSDWGTKSMPTAYMTLMVPWKKSGETDFRTCHYMVPLNMEGKSFERNTYYKINLAVGILGSFEPEEPVDLFPSYTIVDWGKEGIEAPLQTFKYLVVDEDYKEIFNQTTCKIGYASSSEITVKVTEVTYPDYKQGYERINTVPQSALGGYGTSADDNTFTLTHSLAEVSANYVPYTINLTVTNKDGMSEDVVIVQYPSLYMSMGAGDDVFVNGYFARVSGAKFGTQRGSTGVFYSYDYTTRNNGTSSNTGNSNASSYISAGYGVVYNELTTGLQIKGTTNVYVTAFNATNSTYTDNGTTYSYRIGDPRVPGNYKTSDLTSYLTGQSKNGNTYYRTLTAWDDAADIQVGTEVENIIAPAFKISSAWARLGSAELSFSNAKKRCATYQEAGYPAGRWRLPTEAEIKFILKLQNENMILPLFKSTEYFASSGRYITNGRFYKDNNTHFCRCVYDIWYWGEGQLSTNEYHPNERKK